MSIKATITKRSILRLPEQSKEQANRPESLQDPMLNGLFDRQVTVYLKSGIRLTGILKAADQFTLLLEHEGTQQLVFKHTVTTVMQASTERPLGAKSTRRFVPNGGRGDFDNNF